MELKGCFAGVARKVAIPFFVLTAIGWLLVVIGFGLGTERGVINRSTSASYPFWIVSFGGPIVIVAALIQAALQRPYSIFAGAITTFFSVFFITGLGMVLYLNGALIARGVSVDSINLMFAGGLLATLFWTAVMVLQNFYDYSFRKEE